MRKCVSNIPVVLFVNYPEEWLIYNIAKSPLRFHRATTNLVKKNYLFCIDDNPPIRYNT